MRTLNEKQFEDTAGPAFSRFFAGMFVAAAVIGLGLGIVWSIAGLWHFHVHRLW